jgi:hypothetical protein
LFQPFGINDDALGFGFKAFHSAKATIAGIETVYMIQK